MGDEEDREVALLPTRGPNTIGRAVLLVRHYHRKKRGIDDLAQETQCQRQRILRFIGLASAICTFQSEDTFPL